jgi:ABC-type transport system involved in multi-copper enzyme maturation permease subunit
MSPVFVYETVLNARRWHVYAGRSLFVLALLAGMTAIWIVQTTLGPTFRTGQMLSHQQVAKLGESFFYTMAGIQVSLVLLVAPTAAAGSICMDRSRGTLMHMLMTELSDVDIVLGKLLARLAPIVGVIACGVPVAALSALLGGIEFSAIAGTFVVSLALAVLVCTLAITISVWASRTHEVLMAAYVLEGVWLLALPIWSSWSAGGTFMAPPDWFQKANPYVLVLGPFNNPGFIETADYKVFAAVALALSAVLAILSVLKLRRVIIERSGRPQKKLRRLPERNRILPSWAGPTLDGNPVVWREWHRQQSARLAQRLWLAMLFFTWLGAAWGTYGLMHDDNGTVSRGLALGMLFQLLLGSLMLSATAPTVLAHERAHGSLDVLLTTPLPTRSIVVGKWWGAYRNTFVLVILPLYAVILMAGSLPALPDYASQYQNTTQRVFALTAWDRILAVICCPADFLASCALVVSFGLLIATWVRRQGVAIAICVIAYFLTGIAFPMLAISLIGQINSSQSANWVTEHFWLEKCAMSISPIYGAVNPIVALEQFPFVDRSPVWISIGFVILVKTAVAGLLFWLTLATFDRCVGRVSESRSRQSTPEPGIPTELVAVAAH